MERLETRGAETMDLLYGDLCSPIFPRMPKARWKVNPAALSFDPLICPGEPGNITWGEGRFHVIRTLVVHDITRVCIPRVPEFAKVPETSKSVES